MNLVPSPVAKSVFDFEDAARARIDGLDSLLNSFDPQNAESQDALRDQLLLIREEAQFEHIPMIAQTAEKAIHSGVPDRRDLSTVLLSLLRGYVKSGNGNRSLPEADRDPETGLLNREGFEHWVEFLTTTRHAPAAVAAIHVDSYASVLHRHGGTIASKLLVHVGGIISEHLREEDFLAHFSGDEFMLLLPGEQAQGLHAVLARLELAVLRRPFRLPDGGGQETARISSGGYQFIEGVEAEVAGPAGTAPLRIGVIARSRSVEKTVCHALKQHGCEVVLCGSSPHTRYAPLTHHGVGLTILEAGASDLATELAGLRAALSHDRTPILALAADESAARWALDHGACHALVKPVDLHALLQISFRLASRGLKSPAKPVSSAAAAGPVLVASDDLYHLIALGSALHKQGGYEIRLACGSADAIRQLKQHPISTALIDLRLDRDDTHQALRHLAAERQGAPVVLIKNQGEQVPDAGSHLPPFARVIEKPVPLLTLAGDFRRSTGIEPSDHRGGSADIFRHELLRVMRESRHDPNVP